MRMPAAFAVLAALLAPLAALSAEDAGKASYEKWCAPCHAAGMGHPATARLRIDRGEDFAVLVERPDLSFDYIRSSVRAGFMTMPPFRKTEISDAELKAISDYIAAEAARASAEGDKP